jgi:hypothetical protein
MKPYGEIVEVHELRHRITELGTIAVLNASMATLVERHGESPHVTFVVSTQPLHIRLPGWRIEVWDNSPPNVSSLTL